MVEQTRAHGQGVTDLDGVAGVVVVADRQGRVVERGQRVDVFGLQSRKNLRHVCLVEAVAAVLGDHRPRRSASRARSGSAPRKAKPWARCAYTTAPHLLHTCSSTKSD